MAPRRSTRRSLLTAVHPGASPSSATIHTASDDPRSLTPETRHSLKRTTVPNSSDHDDQNTIEAEVSERPSSHRRILKEVAIPAMSLRNSVPTRARLSRVKAPSAEQDSSNGSPSVEESDYDTPGTSIATTPAASIRRANPSASTRRSGLSKAVNASLSRSSSLKRSHNAVPDSDEDTDMIDADAELALQVHLEETEAMHPSKRLKIESNEEDIDSSDEYDINIPISRTKAYRGKGKGKMEGLDSLEDDLELSDVPMTPPAYKGKGKAKVEIESCNRTRSVRSSAKKGSFIPDDMLDYDVSEGEEFQPEDADSVLSDLSTPPPSDSEEEPLMIASSRMKKLAKKASKPVRGKKKKSVTDEVENKRRRARWAHIEDKWERKKAMNRERAEQQHPKLLSMWKDLKKIPILETEKAEQPTSISRRLKPFQLEGLSWMIRQEKTRYKGGLLGDEMGMGKTIQAVSLIMSDYPAKEPTLVCVPPVALMQWSNEIREYTDNKLKVLVYHGTNAKCKKMTLKELRSYDVIMVSYNSLESLHRKETKGWSRGDDIIKEASPLHAIHFHRLILDEAHSIKSRNTGVAKACFALQGSYKWCLSGTPVQNRIGEFFSLLRFLEVRPFADYFCRSCACEKLHWATDDDHMCVACNHGASEHISVFNQELLNPITGDDPELREDALTKLHMITARIMLRRMKRDHTNSMELPMKDVIIHNEFFSDIERDFSSSIMTNSARNFDTYVAQGVMLNNYANIFGLIMQMRQVANHPDLLLKKKSAEGAQNVYVCNICDEPAEDAVRSRCHHEFCRACIKDFMDTCEASGTDADCPRCHIALTIDFEQPELEQDEDSVKKTSIINRIKMENWTSSTKIEMLVYDLYKLRSKKQTLKSIVFSQFTSMLQLIEWRLRRAGFNTVMLDGSMTPAMRQKSIDHFMTNADVEVFLVSLKAGGVALNLTEASRVFIVDPWWNPAAEWQSADRCHRIGQRRPCVITRLCIEDSVESRMVALQEKKAAMIAGTVNNDKVAMDRLSPEDLQFLFRGT
ncbi:SNF2 family N-terminal domain-containing protein [Ampelomyces quisqualis]|uniref:SNF2 family N-terminal domain-containing protein n=1 Tax=Ampelomyces quisqualis TaxID=50730 RepID=A0A6A5QL23_AMPQU|nr:SNF2 family N-terminal domain-containing protein [Ampelomyces quisqualis]